ncbi:hypothetical protein [Clostridium sardiniense]|uniref:hypothetical protein n=1 Tax=Clostridium sardiniense TaxID=29369 RepID=UPI003D341CA1
MRKIKVDQGFELIYLNLSHRRKFIRNLWATPICSILLAFMWYIGDNIILNTTFTILIVAVCSMGLIYNYIEWKKTEKE